VLHNHIDHAGRGNISTLSLQRRPKYKIALLYTVSHYISNMIHIWCHVCTLWRKCFHVQHQSNSDRGNRFLSSPKHPDQIWGPCSQLLIGNWFSQRGKAAATWCWPHVFSSRC